MAKLYGDEITFRDQWKKMKGAGFKEKIDYIWEYYRVTIIVIVSLIILTVSLVSSIIYNSVPNVIQGEFYSEEISDEHLEEIKAQLCEKLGYDPADYHIDLSSAVASMDAEQVYALQQKVVARIAAKDLDFLGADEAYFLPFMSEDDVTYNAFVDLRTVLSEETFARLESEGRIRYLECEYDEAYPYLVDITGSDFYHSLQMYSNDCCIGVTVTAPNPDAVEALMDFVR